MSESDSEPVGFDAEETAQQDDGDFQVGRADLGIEGDGDDFIDEDDLGFDGTEDASDDSGNESSSGGGGGGDAPDIEDAINNGLGRAAVYGLDDPEKTELNTEFTEIAEAFHVGYFGEQIVEEYFSKDIEEIPPELGLAAASIAFAAVVIHKRPDGDKIMREAKWKATDLKDSYLSDDEPAPEPTPGAEEPTPTPDQNVAQTPSPEAEPPTDDADMEEA